MGRFRVFLSAANSEVGRAREALANDLPSHDGVLVRVQRSFTTIAPALLHQLANSIATCDAVVCRVGTQRWLISAVGREERKWGSANSAFPYGSTLKQRRITHWLTPWASGEVIVTRAGLEQDLAVGEEPADFIRGEEGAAHQVAGSTGAGSAGTQPVLLSRLTRSAVFVGFGRQLPAISPIARATGACGYLGVAHVQ